MLPADLEAAIRASWSEASCDPADLPVAAENPAAGSAASRRWSSRTTPAATW